MASKITNHFEVLFIDEEDTQKSNKEQVNAIITGIHFETYDNIWQLMVELVVVN